MTDPRYEAALSGSNSAATEGDSPCSLTADLEAATELAEALLLEAPGFDADTRLVAAADLLWLVQLLNAAQSHCVDEDTASDR